MMYMCAFNINGADYKNLTWVSGMDRQICPEGHILASRGSPSDAKLWPEGQICLSIPDTNDGFFFLLTLMRRRLIFILFT